MIPYQCLTTFLPVKNSLLIAFLPFLPVFCTGDTHIRVRTPSLSLPRAMYPLFRKLVRLVRMVRSRATVTVLTLQKSIKNW